MLTARNRSARCGSQRSRSSASSNLAHAPREWDSQRRLRGSAENPVSLEAVPELKVSDAVDEHSFVDGGLDATAGVWRRITECDQQPAQCRDADVRLARFDGRRE